MRAALTLLAVALLAGCICDRGDKTTGDTAATTTTAKTHPTTTNENPQDSQTCEGIGGRWGRIGLAPRESCNLPTSDGGEKCQDSGECEGACVAEVTDSQKRELMGGKTIQTTGLCTEWKTTVGCRAFVENGKAHMICLD